MATQFSTSAGNLLNNGPGNKETGRTKDGASIAPNALQQLINKGRLLPAALREGRPIKPHWYPSFSL